MMECGDVMECGGDMLALVAVASPLHTTLIIIGNAHSCHFLKLTGMIICFRIWREFREFRLRIKNASDSKSVGVYTETTMFRARQQLTLTGIQ